MSLVPWPASATPPAVTAVSHDLASQGKNLRVREEPSSLPSSSSSSPSTATSPEIPLWDQCGLLPNEICAGEARCICKDQWWSQCRVPLNGSWIPHGEDWACTEPNQGGTNSSSPSLPTNVTNSISESVAKPLESSALPVASYNLPGSAAEPAASSVSKTPPRVSSPSSVINGAVPSSESSRGILVPPMATSASVPSPASNSLSSSASVSLSASASVHASAFAAPFIISLSAGLSSSSSGLSASRSATESTSSSSELTSEPTKPSSSSLLPNLACPSGSAAEEESSHRGSDAATIEACNPAMPADPGNLSSTTNSSFTPPIPEIMEIDPDKGGNYLQADSTPGQQSQCLDIAAHQFQICWEVLNVTGYLLDWVAFNRRTCDDRDMGFADCFLYVEIGSGANCTSFTGRSQCSSPDSREFKGRTNGAQAYYVAFNIWNIQNWFFTYYMAVNGDNGLAAESVDTIARTLNLPEPKKFPILDLLAALAFAFGLLSPSGYAASIPLLGKPIAGLAAQAPGEYLLRAMQNAPTLSRNLVASGNLGDSAVQIAQLNSDLARIVSQLQTNIQNAIVQVMSNFSLFFDFVEEGYFSTQIENLNTVTQNVTLALNTYIVSQSLQNDDVIITRALDTDINELQLNGSAYGYDTDCGHGYDEWGMCGCWWYDSTNRISYGLESQKNMLNNYTKPLESLFSLGITTPELLFLNSQFCADSAGSTQGNAPGTALSTSTSVWNTECISNVKICTWDTLNLGVEHEYTDCERESAFAMEHCDGSWETVSATVPASYIGPYLTSPEYQGVACNAWGKGKGSPNSGW
ncbi:MAG: hypothetical protein L6R38_001240 [Xanthoria sp. 2 TBL-2021]|nr:MAG: hypothetical protein L6R38_001240 [Xanthoria sp. 2 TBL-2021]